MAYQKIDIRKELKLQSKGKPTSISPANLAALVLLTWPK